MSNTETPNERRTRLIEQYAGRNTLKSDWGSTPPIPEQVVHWATQLADAVIHATIPARIGCLKETPEPTRYPSEGETRLIELTQSILDQIDFTQGKTPGDLLETWRGLLAFIKRDIGIT